MKAYGFIPIFENGLSEKIAAEAEKSRYGARALSTICHSMFEPVLFDPEKYLTPETPSAGVDATKNMDQRFVFISKKLFFVSRQLGQVPFKSFFNRLCFDLKKYILVILL